MANKKTISVYCDGACSNNQHDVNIGAWAAIVIEKGEVEEFSGSQPNTTNQRMELLACIYALEILEETENPIQIYSDSAYLVNCIKDKWYVKWMKNGWKNSQKKTVKNKDLWMRLIELVKGQKVIFTKVKGHSNNKWNEKADALAKEAIDNFSQCLNSNK